jgi:hypothetical protein
MQTKAGLSEFVLKGAEALHKKLLALGQDPVLPKFAEETVAAGGKLSFLDFLPKPRETKPYVAKVMAAQKTATSLKPFETSNHHILSLSKS